MEAIAKWGVILPLSLYLLVPSLADYRLYFVIWHGVMGILNITFLLKPNSNTTSLAIRK